MKIFPLSIFFLLTLNLSFAQAYLTGTVRDGVTGEPLPYVNIGVTARNTGTVSDEAGNFTLQKTEVGDTVLISSIGYESRHITVGALAQNGSVRLVPRPYAAPTVEVDASRFGEEKVIGTRLEERNHTIGFGSPELGAEIAALLKIERETLVKSANFVLEHAKGEKLFFRVNLYDFSEGRVGEKLLPEDVVISKAQRPGTLTVDLSRFNLILSGDVLLSLELIKDEDGRGNEGITFRGKRSRRNQNVYLKYTSQAPFRKLGDLLAMAPKLELGFYLTGKE